MNDDDAIVAVSKDYIALGSRGRNSQDYRRFWPSMGNIYLRRERWH